MIPRRWAVPQVLPRFCFLMLEQRHFFDAFLQCKVFMEAYIRSGFWSGSLVNHAGLLFIGISSLLSEVSTRVNKGQP